MNKLKFYKIAAALLLVLNVALIVILLSGKPNHHPGKNLIAHTAEALELNADQLDTFKVLAKNHHLELMELKREQAKLTRLVFESGILIEDSLNSKIIDKILLVEKQKIVMTLAHFNDIKTILKPDQIDRFNKFKKNALNKILGNFRPPRKHRKKI